MDDASAPQPTWGLQGHVLDTLKSDKNLAEVHTRMTRLYPDVSFLHMPVRHMQADVCASSDRALAEPQSQSCPGPVADEETKSRGTPSACSAEAQPSTFQGPGDGHGASSKRPREGDTGGAQCRCFVGNAAVHGDEYQWHVDADPMTIPEDSAWVRAYGQYANRVRTTSATPGHMRNHAVRVCAAHIRKSGTQPRSE